MKENRMNAAGAEAEFVTEGMIFFVDTLDGLKGLIGMPQDDYVKLRSADLIDKQVDLTVCKKDYGVEYVQGAPEVRTKADLYTIKQDGITRKPQIGLEPHQMQELDSKGFRDGEVAILKIVPLPYGTAAEAKYKTPKLKVEGYFKETEE